MENDSIKKKSIAKLVGKNMNRSTLSINGMPCDVTNFFLSFKFADGSQMLFNVPVTVYNLYFENEVGILTYKSQGEKSFFISFERQGYSFSQ